MKEGCLKEARRSLVLARLVGLQVQMTDIPLIFMLPDVCSTCIHSIVFNLSYAAHFELQRARNLIVHEHTSQLSRGFHRG